MMTDDRLDQLLNDARATYDVPPDPPVDQMWASIESAMAERQGGGGTRRPDARWSFIGYAAAAAFVLGVGLGRATSPAPPPDAAALASARPIASVAEPLKRTATDYLGEAEALIRSVQHGTNTDGTYASEAATLLMTTRLLLDSPAANDARLRALLEDLELALVQIAALRGAERSDRSAEELEFIRNVLNEQEMVPRLRTAVVTLTSYDN